MKPVHQLLPALEDAVINRVDDPEISKLGEGDLRTLVYQIVDAYQRRFVDPKVLLEAALSSAETTVGKFREVKSRSVQTRAKILDWLLPLLARAMQSIGIPVRELIRRDGDHAEYFNHPLLCGIELAQHRRLIGPKGGTKTITGRTWWAVALPFDKAGTSHACWAVLDHHGELVGGKGDETIDFTLLQTLQLAEMIDDSMLGEILSTFAGRLRGASNGGGLPRIIEHDERSHQQLLAMLELIGPVK